MLFLSTIQAQEYFEYLGYGISVLAAYLILRKSFKSDVKKLESMVGTKANDCDLKSLEGIVNKKADVTALEKLEKDTKSEIAKNKNDITSHFDTRFEDFKEFILTVINNKGN